MSLNQDLAEQMEKYTIITAIEAKLVSFPFTSIKIKN